MGETDRQTDGRTDGRITALPNTSYRRRERQHNNNECIGHRTLGPEHVLAASALPLVSQFQYTPTAGQTDVRQTDRQTDRHQNDAYTLSCMNVSMSSVITRHWGGVVTQRYTALDLRPRGHGFDPRRGV